MPYGGYPTANRDYASYYSAPAKRQRTQMGFGGRGMMDTYPQAATVFSNPPGPYQTPMMSGYAGHAGVPDYATRQPAVVPSTPTTTYGSSDDPMLAVRSSPGSAYVARYPTYTDGQMPYGIPPSTQLAQVAEPGGANRPSQQTPVQPLMPVNQPGTSMDPSWPNLIGDSEAK